MRHCASIVCALAICSEAWAGVSYSYQAEFPAYVLTGSSTVVRVYFAEALDSAAASLIDADGGLFSARFRITRISGDSALVSAADSVGAAMQAAAFGGAGSDTWVMVRKDIDQAAVLTDGGRVWLANLTLTPTGGSQTSVFVIAPDTVSRNTLTAGHGYDLDVSSADPAYTGATATAFSVAVPEPSSMAASAGFATMLLRRRRCRWGGREPA